MDSGAGIGPMGDGGNEAAALVELQAVQEANGHHVPPHLRAGLDITDPRLQEEGDVLLQDVDAAPVVRLDAVEEPADHQSNGLSKLRIGGGMLGFGVAAAVFVGIQLTGVGAVATVAVGCFALIGAFGAALAGVGLKEAIGDEDTTKVDMAINFIGGAIVGAALGLMVGISVTTSAGLLGVTELNKPLFLGSLAFAISGSSIPQAWALGRRRDEEEDDERKVSGIPPGLESVEPEPDVGPAPGLSESGRGIKHGRKEDH